MSTGHWRRWSLGFVLIALPGFAQDALPRVEITAAGTVIKSSCRVAIAAGRLLPAGNAPGAAAIVVGADGITLDFEPAAELRGAGSETPPDTMAGIGIRIEGHRRVTIRGARVSGYRAGIHATNADGLLIENTTVHDVFRQHLRSTPKAEDGADWLHPHDNDQNEWLTSYGAAIYLENSKNVTVRGCTVRGSQNGLLLDRVQDAKIYGNDCSFLSGWGLGLWRSSDNLISRNAFDFCVRGYSHGVYNRGQDSAGILIFEQCSKNTFVENSATHGGDCVFGFAGREALGEARAKEKGFDYQRRGCNDNLFVDNDFSYGVAHGIEMTFSFGNRIVRNRFVGNAICGIWGGYSQETVIQDNTFDENGGMGYGLERGGVNIEHGYRNEIAYNQFTRNRCGVHLWGRENADFAKRAWGKANYRGGRENVIAFNSFGANEVMLHLRDLADTAWFGNAVEAGANARRIEGQANLVETKRDVAHAKADVTPLGEHRPVGARLELRGRENIIMTEWGPWDHATPLIQPIETGGAHHVYALHRIEQPRIASTEGGVTAQIATPRNRAPIRLEIDAKEPGVHPYRVKIAGTGYTGEVAGTLISAAWKVSFFPCHGKPNDDPASFDTDRKGPEVIAIETDRVDFKFGMNGPAQLGQDEKLTNSKLGRDHFGLVATTSLLLPAGKWRFTTLSDDGVRLSVGGRQLINNWTWHVPTRNEGVFESAGGAAVPIELDYFELDGFATLSLEIEPVP